MAMKEKNMGRDYPLAPTPPVKDGNLLNSVKQKMQKANTNYISSVKGSNTEKKYKEEFEKYEKQYEALKAQQKNK
jgi:hypothetical protein